jgi:hypothetical protein
MSLAPIGRSKHIVWHLTSKKDPRWNASGRDVVAMIFQTAPSATKAITRNKKKYGKPPSDLEYTAHKE